MENRNDLNQEFNDLRAQFKMLTEKVEKQKITTDQLLQQVSKGKIYKYEFLNKGVIFIISCIVCPYVMFQMYLEEYPIWTYFSIVYMWLLVVLLNVFVYKKQKKYLRKIGYDVVQYTEDLKRNKHLSSKMTIMTIGLFLPVFIHLGFFLNYIISQGENLFGIQSWWIYLGTSITLIIIISIILGKVIDKITIRVLK